jgi:hypothetical protein
MKVDSTSVHMIYLFIPLASDARRTNYKYRYATTPGQLCYGAVLSKGRRRRRIKKRNRKSADISAEPFGIIVRWANRKKERKKEKETR